VATNTEQTWASARPPEEGVEQWADRYGLDPLLVPLAYRKTNPIEVGQKLSASIANLPETSARLLPRRVFDRKPEPDILRHHMELRGSWKITRTGRRKFVNPTYVHIESFEQDTVTTTDERLRVLDRVAATGMPTLEDLAPRFDLSLGELHAFCKAHDVEWAEKRRAGRRRLARTARVAVEWGYSLSAVADALPLTTAALGQWIHEYGQMDHVPQDPSLGIRRGGER
jgi:hypothetical protein